MSDREIRQGDLICMVDSLSLENCDVKKGDLCLVLNVRTPDGSSWSRSFDVKFSTRLDVLIVYCDEIALVTPIEKCYDY